MPLHILGILVVIGVVLIVSVVHLSGGSRTVGRIDEESARDRFALDFPNSDIEKVVVSSNGEAALLVLSDELEMGLVQRMGSQSLTRLLTVDVLKDVSANDASLRMRLKDFTLPSTEFRFADQKEFGIVKKQLDRILESA